MTNRSNRSRTSRLTRLAQCAGLATCLVVVNLSCGASSQKKDASSGNDPFVADVVARSGNWSDASTWPEGAIPQKGESVSIPKGVQVILDTSPPPLGDVLIEGELSFAEVDLELSADNVMVHGRLVVGTEDKPHVHKATITLTSAEPDKDLMGMGTRGLTIMGGELDLHGVAPSPTWTRISADLPAGGTKITLDEDSDWKAGDQTIVAPTDYFYVGRTEAFTLKSASGNQLELDGGVAQPRWGKLQYLSKTGVSLEPGDGAQILDERAEVANLTRNIVVQGPDDALWSDQKFGAHVMFMEGATIRIDGVEFRRVGQAGRLGRYPIHFHRMSYDPNGAELADLTGQYVRRSSIWDSSQRCIVIHATNGLTVEDNTCYKIRGHAVFLEDAVERRNEIRGNLVLQVLAVDDDDLLLNHEKISNGPSGYWITNPDNVVEDNVAADCQGHGFWLAFPDKSLGASAAVEMYPTHMKPGSFSGLVAHSNGLFGIMFDQSQKDAEGNTQALSYTPTADETPDGTQVPFSVDSFVSYKHSQTGWGGYGAFWNNSRNGTYKNFIVADFSGLGFKGASLNCTITENFVVGTSLNNANPPEDDSVPPAAVATYHSACDIIDNTFIDIPLVEGKVSGAFSTNDYYIRPVDRGLVRDVNNTLVNTPPGWRMPSPNVTGTDNWALAGALWDPYGFWGPKENYWVYDDPFFTAGTTCQPVAPEGNGVSCVGPYFGIPLPQINGEYEQFMPIEVTRTDAAGSWTVGDGATATKLGNMRHAAVVQDGTFILRSPGKEVSSTLVTVENLLQATDSFMLGIQYTAKTSPKTAYVTSWPGGGIVNEESYAAFKAGDPNWKEAFRGEYWDPLKAAASFEEVAASNGTSFFHDVDEELIWVRCKGLVEPFLKDVEKFSDYDLYRPVYYAFFAEEQ